MTFAVATRRNKMHIGPIPKGGWMKTFCGKTLMWSGYYGTPEWCDECEAAWDAA